VRAELTIPHKQGDMLGLLESIYGANDVNALRASEFARKSPGSAAAIGYSARTPDLIVMAWFAPREVQIYVESSGGRLREGAVRVWSAIHDGGNALKPKLGRLVIFNEDASDRLASGYCGIGVILRREDLFLPVATGLVTAVILGAAKLLGHVSADFLYGSATSLVVAILSVGRLLRSSISKEVVWR
jgi:hypothetical protein